LNSHPLISSLKKVRSVQQTVTKAEIVIGSIMDSYGGFPIRLHATKKAPSKRTGLSIPQTTKEYLKNILNIGYRLVSKL